MQHQVEARALRLFLGLPLPPASCEALVGWQQGQPGIERWSPPGGLHLTLAFLGGRTPEALPILEACTAAVAGRHGTFDLCTAALGGFPTLRATRVLWLGLAPCPALEALAVDLRETLAACGEVFDAKPFHPHLTLARFHRARSVAGFIAPAPMGFKADSLVLFESRPQGCYTPLRTWHFRGV